MTMAMSIPMSNSNNNNNNNNNNNLKYTLDDFTSITFQGFVFDFPPEVLKIISDLSFEVGSPNYVKTPTFTKRPEVLVEDIFHRKKQRNTNANTNTNVNANTYTSSLLEQPVKSTFETQLSVIRSHLNKLTDKNYKDISTKIIQLLDEIFLSNSLEVQLIAMGNAMFEIASTNRFYSKVYAKLYAELIQKYQIMKDIFEKNFNEFMGLFSNIEYVDMEIDYETFCKNNKNNEKRKAVATFFVNLMENKVIEESAIIQLLRNLMELVFTHVHLENKKNEVDEWTENIAILYNKEMVKKSYECINGSTIQELIHLFGHSKVKTYPSLSSRSIFKYLDLSEKS